MTTKALRPFQIFAKPIGPSCNLNCVYCYYVEKQGYYPGRKSFRMPLEILENYIRQHIKAAPNALIRFSWHGGEPTLLGLDYFREIVALQHKHRPPNKRIVNGIQTNGTQLDDDWCRFLSKEHFSIGLSLDGPAALHDPMRITKQNKPTHADAMRGYHLLNKYGVVPDILCVVSAVNVEHPLEVYNFFKQIKARYIGFLPLVTPEADAENGLSRFSVRPEAFGKGKWTGLPSYCRDCEVLEMCHGECPKNRIIRTPGGEQGLNVLCAGYRRFFNHCRPFVSALATAAGHQRLMESHGFQARAGNRPPHPKTGRNDPCPCGSGRKYKKCCLGKKPVRSSISH